MQRKYDMSYILYLERCVHYLNWGVILALALSFAFGAGSIIYGAKLRRAENAEAARYREASEVQMKQATARIGEADARIREANVKVEGARAEAARANKGNTQLRVELERATESLVHEQTKLASAQESLAHAERERAETQLTLEKTLEAVRLRQMPRTLTADQRKDFVRLLQVGPMGEVEISCIAADQESAAYATELAGLLKTAGWNLKGNKIDRELNASIRPIGLSIIVRDINAAPARARTLQDAFKGIGLDVGGFNNPGSGKDDILLFVGNKP